MWTVIRGLAREPEVATANSLIEIRAQLSIDPGQEEVAIPHARATLANSDRDLACWHQVWDQTVA